MASYNELNALIDAYINRNGVQAITGQILNGVLKAMVEQLGRGYTIMGAAIPTTDPGTPDGPECYFASETGTYTDFDGLQVAPGELALLCYTPSDGWTKATIYEGFRQVGATIDGNVGTPSVGVSYADGVLSFDFHNMKGNPGQNGQDGAAAGFGTIGADITGGVGTPGVSVESSGPATAKNLQFHFTNLKGETGVTSVVATVDNTTGTPACTVSLVGQQLTLAFSGLKGAQGDTGVSADYPIAIINNLTTDDPASALSAAQGVVLDGKISQLEAKVNDLNTLLEEGVRHTDESIIDYSPVGVTDIVGSGFWAAIASKSQPDREKDGILKEITVTTAYSTAKTFSIKRYKKVWSGGVITSFTEVADSAVALSMPANQTALNVLSQNIPVARDEIIAIEGIGKYTSTGTNYAMLNGAYVSGFSSGNFGFNVDYIVRFEEKTLERIDDIESRLSTVEGQAGPAIEKAETALAKSTLNEDELGILKNVLEVGPAIETKSIVDYTPGGDTAIVFTNNYWGVLRSDTMPDREKNGILGKITIGKVYDTDTNFAIKLYKKVWTDGVITGFSEIANGVYSFVLPANTLEIDVSQSEIPIAVDTIILITGIGHFSQEVSDINNNKCIINGAYNANFSGHFRMDVDYFVGFPTLESERIDALEERVEVVEEKVDSFVGIYDAVQKANIVLFGDSITWLGGDDCDGRETPSKGWSTYFKGITNPKTIRSYARSGATWSHTANTVYDIVENTGLLSDDNVIYNQINRLLSDISGGTQVVPDIIIIAAGTNDAWYPGARPDALSVSADTEFANTDGYITGQAVGTLTSIAAAMRYDVEMLKTNFPNAQIFVTTPLQATAFTLSKCFDVGTIIRECAEYLSVECLEQGKKAGIYRAQEKTEYLFTYDGTHTSPLGAKMVGQFLATEVSRMYRDKIS